MSSKRIFLICTLIGILIFLIFFTNKDNKIKNYPPKNNTIIAFGDSLIEGVGSTPENDFVSIVGNNVGRKIINMGKSGDTTESALTRVNDVLFLDPGIVLLLLGGNDVLRRIPKNQTFQNLETIITKIQQSGSVVLLIGIRGGILTDNYEDDFNNLAKKYQTGYVSNVLKNLITKRELMYDGIHPNDNGYAIIAERVTSILKKLVK